jgi:hypothetical protein
MAWGTAAAAGLWLVDRILVACELRGWIAYRLSPRPRHEFRRAAGSALVGLDGLFRPAARHVAAVTREAAVHREADAEGDGPSPGDGGDTNRGDRRPSF